jgi:acetolactate synthase small subunit
MKSAQLEQMYRRIDDLENKVAVMTREKEKSLKRADSLY